MPYEYLRVEETPGRETFPVSAAPDPVVVKALQDAEYYKREMQRAIREREEIKRSLDATDGPAADWRRQAKTALVKLSDARRTIDNMRKRDEEQRTRAIHFSEEVDALKAQITTLKRDLWDVFTDIADSPVRKKLWTIWASL